MKYASWYAAKGYECAVERMAKRMSGPYGKSEYYTNKALLLEAAETAGKGNMRETVSAGVCQRIFNGFQYHLAAVSRARYSINLK